MPQIASDVDAGEVDHASLSNKEPASAPGDTKVALNVATLAAGDMELVKVAPLASADIAEAANPVGALETLVKDLSDRTRVMFSNQPRAPLEDTLEA